MIRIGLEATPIELQREILSHPARFFSILAVEGQAQLCIMTCNRRGENLQSHVVDGLSPRPDGSLKSVFEDSLNAFCQDQASKPGGLQDGHYVISPDLERAISEVPGLVGWIISSVLTEDRNILISNSWILEESHLAQ